MQRSIGYTILLFLFCCCNTVAKKEVFWQAPDTARIPATDEGRLIRFGRDLIANTAHYLGPKGKTAAISNGMNCQNCHLDAGTRSWGNNYAAVFSTYPKYRDRSGSVEDIYRRVNDCLERSLNGRQLDTNSREMKAIYTYLKWLGQNVPKGAKPTGTGIRDLPFLARAADPEKGRTVYEQTCRRCHGAGGEGQKNTDSTGYVYPPLWGEHSFTTAAGLYRLSRLAGYVKDNMPLGCTHDKPLLTNEEAWDVAAFINSRGRPERVFPADWPDIAHKPLDHPFGPYADSFSTQQHKYGPYGPIQHARR
ncbi:MAG TPA: c-type cytochrome [Puia sp.]|jgi:thiosulfate dehydrogenase|nr:c-type cytochrome [Puia sp.]